MGFVLSGLSGRLAGATMALSAPLSVPAMPLVSEWATALGMAENPVGALLFCVAAVRLLVGVGLCLRTGGDAGASASVFGDATGTTGREDRSRAVGTASYTPIPSR